MTRGLSATNQTEIAKATVQVVLLAKLEFDTPVYAHSGIGTITFGGNDYLGVGDFGGISDARESELLGPAPLNLSLSGIDSDLVNEALDSGSYGDVITIYEGYKADDGTLVADPWIVWKGWLEYSQLKRGEDNTITLICQHDLAVLGEKEGSRFSDEDQQDKYSGDLGLEFIHSTVNKTLFWGGGPTRAGSAPGFPGPRGQRRGQRRWRSRG